MTVGDALREMRKLLVERRSAPGCRADSPWQTDPWFAMATACGDDSGALNSALDLLDELSPSQLPFLLWADERPTQEVTSLLGRAILAAERRK